jgi:hypothetical protein
MQGGVYLSEKCYERLKFGDVDISKRLTVACNEVKYVPSV